MPSPAKPANPIARHAASRVRTALADTRIVALVGPRQSGKTTLARKTAAEQKMHFITLDDDQSRAVANDDPAGFMRGLDRVVIDEVQRAPGLILALKKTVDEDPRPGRFLITGSVDLFKGTISPDSLAGRVETIELLPFSQAEIERRKPSAFLDRAFRGDFPALKETGVSPSLIRRVLGGGYPEALARADAARRQTWFRSYVNALATRDIAEIADVTKPAELARLIHHAGVIASQTVNLSALAAPLGVDAKTVDRWLTLLEQMFVLRRLPAWHRNDLKRLTKAPKLHFLDSGLLAALRRTGVADIQADRAKLGGLLEVFVYSELVKLIGQGADDTHISHYRDRDQVEVDFILEQAGKIVCIEVKAAASAQAHDFSAMKQIREISSKAFVCGILLHDGDRIQRMGDRFYAMPFSQLWT